MRGRILNYISSHDDGDPFDRDRNHPMVAGTRLLLAPGGAQIYYGDELARPLTIQGAQGDAHLRSFMNWESLDGQGREVFDHWGRIGRFRRDHPAIGAGIHTTLSESPFVFTRILENESINDKVLVALDVEGTIPVNGAYPDGTVLHDAYSNKEYTVSADAITLEEPASVVLLSELP